MEFTTLITSNYEETKEFGFNFARNLNPGSIVALYGELGAGKTEFIKGICNYFEVDEIVNSPTFTIINRYIGSLNHEEIIIFHIDLYRIKSLKELKDIGFDEYIFSEDSIKLIEWADKAEVILPEQIYSIHIKLNAQNENERTFIISPKIQL